MATERQKKAVKRSVEIRDILVDAGMRGDATTVDGLIQCAYLLATATKPNDPLDYKALTLEEAEADTDFDHLTL